MSNENEKGRVDFQQLVHKHPIATIAVVLGVWTGLLLTGFAIFLQGTTASKNDYINLLEHQKKFLEVELDSLRRVAKTDSVFVLCPGDAVPFFEGEVTVTLEHVKSEGGTWEHLAQFVIANVSTERE